MHTSELQLCVWLVSGVFVSASVVISAHLIIMHRRHCSAPHIQSKTIGILWMVPIYGVNSWLSLRFPDAAIYLDMLRDCYEAYVLYLFLALMIAYLATEGDESGTGGNKAGGGGGGYWGTQADGDEDEEALHLEQQRQRAAPEEYVVHAILAEKGREGPVYQLFPCNLCCRRPIPQGAEFLRWCKRGTLQYSIVKPLMTFVALMMETQGKYQEANFSPKYGWIWVTVIVNISVGYSFYCLGMFYIVLKKALEPHNPVPKFLCIKAVIFFSFWQSVVIAALAQFQLIHDIGQYSADDVATGLQDTLICFEMFLAAIAHVYAFSYKPFVGGAGGLNASLLDAHFAHDGAIRDFNEVMPVLLPRNFKSRVAQTKRTFQGLLNLETEEEEATRTAREQARPGGTTSTAAPIAAGAAAVRTQELPPGQRLQQQSSSSSKSKSKSKRKGEEQRKQGSRSSRRWRSEAASYEPVPPGGSGTDDMDHDDDSFDADITFSHRAQPYAPASSTSVHDDSGARMLIGVNVGVISHGAAPPR